jgi:hypothetical protein
MITLEHFQKNILSVLLLTLVVALAATSGQSLWIDEANSAAKAMTPSISTLIGAMAIDRNSDLQMPLYMILLWSWEKLVGSSEFALRALNVPLFVGAVAVACYGLRTHLAKPALYAIFACCSAFLWAYLDEVRPYMLQFFAATVTMVPLFALARLMEAPKTKSLVIFAAGLFVLCSSSLVGVVFAAFFGLAFLVLWFQVEPVPSIIKRRDVWLLVAAWLVPFSLLGAYYGWTLYVGAKASNVGCTNIWSTGFCIYETFGFSGYGPGRTELRVSPLSALRADWLLLSVHAVVLALFLIAGMAAAKTEIFASSPKYAFREKSTRGIILLGGFVLLACVAVLAIGVVKDFRVVGRHLMPALPFVFLLLAWLGGILMQQKIIVYKVILAICLLSSLCSAILFRISPAHAKDAYRSAATIANNMVACGKVIWWAADGAAAKYYGLNPIDTMHALGNRSVLQPSPVNTLQTAMNTSPISTPRAYFAINSTVESLHNLPYPNVVILSKADIYDSSGQLQAWLEEQHFVTSEKFPAFEIWSKANNP